MNIIDLFAACLTPVVAIVSIAFTWRQYCLDKKKREDDLFDRRYDFYQKIRTAWISTHPHNSNKDWTIEDWIPFAEESQFIFGKDIANHILSFAGKHHQGSPFFPDDKFVEPFQKYLKLK
jgi:hypothetical protein